MERRHTHDKRDRYHEAQRRVGVAVRCKCNEPRYHGHGGQGPLPKAVILLAKKLNANPRRSHAKLHHNAEQVDGEEVESNASLESLTAQYACV